MSRPLNLGDFSYRSRVVDEAALRKAVDETPFCDESFDVLEELLQSVELAALIAYLDDAGAPRAMARDEAIQAGLLMRCAKLQEGLLDPGVRSRMELFAVLWRSTIETAVNAIYLVRFGRPDIFDAYVGYSLRLEKRLLEGVQADVAQRNSPPLPIQERMLAGIPHAFELAGMAPDDVDGDDRTDWSGRRGMYGRFDAIGWKGLYPLFSIGSHYSHGNWHDLSVHHLARRSDGFVVAPDFTPVRCQPVLGAVKILASAAHVYLTTKVAPSDDRETLEDRIGFCGQKAELIEELHEQFLARG